MFFSKVQIVIFYDTQKGHKQRCRKLVSVPEWMLLAQKWFWPTVCFLRVGTTQIFIEPLQDTNWHISLRGAERCRAPLHCYYKAAHPSDSSGQLWKRDLDASFLKGLNSIQVAISAISQDKALLLFQTLFHFRVCKEGTLTLGWLEFSTLDTNLSQLNFWVIEASQQTYVWKFNCKYRNDISKNNILLTVQMQTYSAAYFEKFKSPYFTCPLLHYWTIWHWKTFELCVSMVRKAHFNDYKWFKGDKDSSDWIA